MSRGHLKNPQEKTNQSQWNSEQHESFLTVWPRFLHGDKSCGFFLTCGEQTMRNLWELDISTAISAGWDWQLQKGARAKCSTAACHKMFKCKEYGPQVPLFLINTKTRHPENCCSASLFATAYNKLAGGGQGCCASPPEHQAHLIPVFSHVCLLSFLNLQTLPLRFLGWAPAGREIFLTV
jgi:hypothetical protein